jgi:pSer/pThr/pTyr-binding forkhead associated (FHA) protein
MQIMSVELGINGHTRSWDLDSERYVVIGRHPSCDIPVDDPYVSRRHAVIFYDRGAFRIHNLSRTNPVILNDTFQVAHNQNVLLNLGDTVEVGLTSLRVGSRAGVPTD